MHEVKTDALEASFEALEREDEDVAALLKDRAISGRSFAYRSSRGR